MGRCTVLDPASTTSRWSFALVMTLCFAQASCAEHASRLVPLPPAHDGGSEQQDAAPPVDANADLFHPPDAADDSATPCPSGTPSLLALNLYAPVQAAIDACNSRLTPRNCVDGVCEAVIQHCGRRVLGFDASGCAIDFSAVFTSDALASEAAACVLAELAGSCMPCAAELEADAYLSCTD
jgi:hypothetical protein